MNLNPSDPADVGYPATLPIELALRVAPTKDICDAYGITAEQWDVLRGNLVFQRDLAQAVETVRQEGMSFRLKARMQAEDLLSKSYAMVVDQETPPSVRADLIKATVRWAGYDAPPQAMQEKAAGAGFSITINIPAPAAQRDARVVVDQ